jgi:hypothetical protein
MSSHGELRGIEGFPHIAHHSSVWFALARARLDADRRPTPNYEHRLVSLMVRFFASRTLPTPDELAAVVGDCLDELRVVAFDPHADKDRVAAGSQAASWLRLADREYAGCDPEPSR